MSDDDKTRYKAELPANIGPFKQLLEAYSQIPSEAVEARIHKTRDQAYAIAPYPGFGLGQNIRQLAHAGVPHPRLFAVDLRADLMELGFELFRDREKLNGATFITGDVLGASDANLRALDGRVSIVHAANLFHLFSWDVQAASVEPGHRALLPLHSEEQYLHDHASFQRLWDEIGERTGTRWRAEVEMLGKMPPGYAYLGEAARYSRFLIWRM